MVQVTLRYDSVGILSRLSSLDLTRRTAFSAACSERLASLYIRYAVMAGRNRGAVFRSILDDVWRAVGGSGDDLEPLRNPSNELVPDEDGEWAPGLGFAQNAAISLACAVEGWLNDDPNEAASAAMQVYEAADLAAGEIVESSGLVNRSEYGDASWEKAVLDDKIVQTALEGIYHDLLYVESREDFSRLAELAAEEGHAWASTFPWPGQGAPAGQLGPWG